MKRKIIEKKTGRSFPSAFIFISETRIDPELRNSQLHTKVFLYKNEAVKYSGNFKSTEYTNNDLIRLLNKEIMDHTKIGYQSPRKR